MMNDYLQMLAGVACAGVGGELFVRGTVDLARWARIPPGIIGATVAAFATSSPELSVSLSAALSGNSGIALGDALGSNVVNVALVFGIALFIGGVHMPRDSVLRDFGAALLVPFVTVFLLLDNRLSRTDGLLLLCVFSVWLAATVREARRQRSKAEAVKHEKHWRIVTACIAGLICLIAAGRFIVSGALGIAAALGIDEFIIGATLVAVGTSTPELATTIVAKLRGHDDLGLGTVLGSNIFNGVFIVGMAAIVSPITVIWQEVGVALLFGVFALLLVYPQSAGTLGRRRGFLLLSLYVVYLRVIVQSTVT